MRLLAAAAFVLIVTAPAASAVERAAASPGERIELVDRRTPTSKTFRDGDGTFTTEVHAAPIHYRDRSGALRPISSKMVQRPEGGYAWRNEANSFDVQFKPVLADRYLRFRVGGRAFTLTLEGAAARTAAVSGSRVTYPDALRGVDLRYDLSARGVKETLVLADADVALRYRFSLELPGRLPVSAKRLSGGAWAFTAPGHAGPIFVLAPPTIAEAADATLRQGERGPADAVSLDVRRTGARFVVELAVGEQWLRAPERHFPVLLDPTVVLQPALQDGNWDITCGTCTGYEGTPLWMGGDEYSKWRVGVKFDLSDVPPGATVNAATLSLWNDVDSCLWTSSGACSTANHTINVHRMTTAWDGWDSTWNQVGWDPAVTIASTTVSGSAPSGWLNWDVKSQVVNWTAGTQPNHGLLLKRSTEALNSGGPGALGTDALDPTQAPKLVVNYTSDAVKLYKPETLHGNGADLRWSAYTNPDGHPFQKLEIHRSPTPGFTPSASTLIATIGDPAVTSYRDTTAAPNKAFTYKVVTNGWPSYEQTVTLPGDGQATKTIQLGPEERATYLNYMTGDPNCSNYGADEWMYVGHDTDDWTPRTDWFYRPVIAFDLRDVPAGATVSNATLSLYTDFMPPTNNVTVNVHRVTAAWKEGTGLGECTGDGATWVETEGGIKWTTAGGDYDPTVLSSVTHGPNDLSGTWDNFNITAAVQKWVNGDAPNHGVLLKFAAETPTVSADWFAYMTDDAIDAAQRPKLALTYSDGSYAQGPATAVASPAPSELVSGSAVAITGAASDDGRVSKVEFLADGAVVANDTTEPYSATWNTTTVTNASHTLTTRATDDAGNVTTSSGRSVTVENSAAPSTSVTAPAANATVSGTAVTATANASGGRPISKVEFFVDGLRFAEDTTSPYSATWNTLDATQPAYDGAHTLSTVAYDSVGRKASSTDVAVTVANTASTKFKGGFSSTDFPQAVIYDPAASTQETYGIDVTVTNNSAVTWAASDVVAKYRWYSPDATPVVTDGPEVSLGTDLPAGQSRTVRVLAEPPALPDGVTKAQYRLAVDLYSKADASWFAGKGNKPLENPVIVNKALVRGALGFEPYYQYVGEQLGAGMRHEVNVPNGNSLVRWTPFDAPGRGLNTTLTLTHNALEKKCECPAGNNFSIAISSLTRFGNPIDVHPNKADEIAGRSNKYIELTDADGTTHRFTSNDGITYQEPDGVHLFLRRYSTTDLARKWAATTPDRVTYFYDSEGYPTFVEDGNGNKLTYTLEATPPAEDPGGPKKRITKVTDAGGRDFTITYWAKAEKVKSHVRGKIKRVTDHSGSALDFEYYEDGNLRKLIQRGGTNADGTFLADRSFVFTYTTSDGSAPAIPLAANRVDPDPRTPNQSTRLYSVRDSRGNETLFSYLGPGNGEDRWKIASRTDRSGAVTSYAYDIVNRVTTVTLPLSRVWKYGYDVEGKVTSITNPLNETATHAWSGDRMLTKITEPTGKYVEFAYNANGLKTDEWDQLRNRRTYEYENLTVKDAGGTTSDVAANWKAGRTIPHLSQLRAETAPKGTATATPTTDYQWSYAYDATGNPTTITDPAGATTTMTYNADGTLATAKDANGYTTTYSAYDANGLATRIVDARGGIGTKFYNADGLLVWSQDPLHANDTGADPREYRTYVDYDSFHRAGRTSTPKSTRHQRGVLIWSSTKYDPNDNAIVSTSPSFSPTGGPAVTRTYDAMDRPIVVTGPDTSVDPAGERFTYRYDGAGRPVQYTAPKGVMTTSTDQDYADFLTYDAADRITKETEHDVNSSGVVVRSAHTHYCYDLAGDLVRTTAASAGLATLDCSAPPAPATTRMTYDAAHRLTTTIDPGGNQTTLGYDADDNITSASDESGATMTYGFDERDDLVKEVEPFDRTRTPARVLTTLYEYDPVGHVKREISPRAWDASTDKQTFTDYVTAYRYDELGREVRVDLPTSASAPQAQYVHTTYDANGNVTSHSLPVTTSDPLLVPATKKTTIDPFDTGLGEKVKDPANPAVHFDYDAAGHQTMRTPEDRFGNLDLTQRMTWTYDVDGQLARVTDRGGQSTGYDYDADGNLTTVDEARGITTPGQDPIDVRLSYDSFDQLAKLRQKARNQTDYRFTSYTYDLNGNVTNVEEGGLENASETLLTPGRKYELTYDATDFVSSIVDRGPTTGAGDDLRVTSTYDVTGVLASEKFERSDAGGAWSLGRGTTYRYYDNGLLKSQETTNQPGAVLESHALEYENSAGVYLDGNRTKDTYTLAGPQAAPCQTSACTATYGFDPRARLVEERNTRDGVTTTTSYTLDTAGNITTVDRNGAITTYTYVGDQLTSRTRGGDTRKYQYDNEGNLDCITGDTGTRDDCSPPTGTTPSATLRADFGYDYLNRMSSYRSYATGGTVHRSTEYAYNALGRLAEERELVRPGGSPRTSLFSHFASGDVSREEQKDSATGAPLATKDYTYGGAAGRTSVTVTPSGQQATSYAYGHDRQGSISMLVGQDGQAKSSYAYDAYGQADAQLSHGDTGDPLNAYRYSSKRFDIGSSLLDMEARRFDPDDSRFLQQDRLDDAVGDLQLTVGATTQNRYALAGGNPVSYVELNGNSATEVERYQGRKPRTHTFGIPHDPRVGVVRGGLFIASCRLLLIGRGDCRGFHQHADPSRYRAFFQLDYRTGRGRMRVNPSCAKVWRVRVCFRPNPITTWVPHRLAWRFRVNRIETGEFLASEVLLTTDLYIKTSLVASTGPGWLPYRPPPPPAISNLWEFHRRSGSSWLGFTPIDIGYRRDSYPSMEWYQDVRGHTDTICRQRETSLRHLAPPSDDLEGFCYSPEGIV